MDTKNKHLMIENLSLNSRCGLVFTSRSIINMSLTYRLISNCVVEKEEIKSFIAFLRFSNNPGEF